MSHVRLTIDSVTIDVNYHDEFEETAHPRDPSGKFGKGPLTKYGAHVESARSVKGNAEYTVRQPRPEISSTAEHKHVVTLKPSGDLHKHVVETKNGPVSVPRTASKQQTDVHEAIRLHHEQHGPVADPDTHLSIQKRGSAGAQIKANAAASAKVKKLF